MACCNKVKLLSPGNIFNCSSLNACSIDSLNDVDTTTVTPLVGQFLKWDGTNWIPGNCLGKFRVVQPLIMGNNVIAHNLNLTDTAVTVEVRDDVTGALITARVIAETANTTTIDVGTAVAAARITIIG